MRDLLSLNTRDMSRAVRVMSALMLVGALHDSARAGSWPDPIAPAATGQLQCYVPDVARKVCAALAGYRTGADGQIDNVAVVLVSENPAITMEIVSPVDVKAGQVCGRIRERDIDAAKFVAADRELNVGQIAVLRLWARTLQKSIVGHEICTTYLPYGATLLAKATVDGAPMPATTDQQVLWVSPDAGYRVGP